jgi:predicted metal-dependent phosphotriesterase family hydrolase
MPPEALAGGATLFHEHLSVGSDFMPRVMSQFRDLLGPQAILPPLAPPEQRRLMEDLDVMAEEMRLAAAEGVACIVDAGHPDIARWDEEQITQELLRQTKADAIGAFGEIGTWDAMTPNERKVFRAVGKAHLATNLPIFTHTNMGKGAAGRVKLGAAALNRR